MRPLRTDTDATPEEPRGSVAPAPVFEQVYAEHFAFVWRSPARLGVPHSALDDACQNVFLVVHRRLSEFEGRASLRTWLFRITHKVAADARRTQRRKGAVDELSDAVADSAPDPAERAARGEALSVLERLLDQLEDDRRAVFVLAELEQLPLHEIADALGLNPNTAGSRLRLARRDFDAALARYHAAARTGRNPR
jgi:RNA polymerase sigma-70 factor (ECF subfamily)